MFENKGNLYDLVKKSKFPIFILGQSFFKLKSAKFLFKKIKDFLVLNNKINDQWNALNIISNHASTVGAYDLELVSSNNGKNVALQNIKNNNFDFIFLFGQDNLEFKKKNEFIVYIGSHGDKGAEIADIILPGSAYTEQDGYYTNLEGKVQKSFKATYPPGNAKEDWIIINELSELLKRKKLYNDKDELLDNMFNYMKVKKKEKFNEDVEIDQLDEKIKVESIDYYYSNVIARASKTMNDCRNIKLKIKPTGTEG